MACETLLGISDSESPAGRAGDESGGATVVTFELGGGEAGMPPSSGGAGSPGDATAGAGLGGIGGDEPGGGSVAGTTSGGQGGDAEHSGELTVERVARVRFPWPRRFLSVCFRELESPSAEEQGQRERLRRTVRRLVNAHWARYSALDFYGFQTCDEAADLEVALTRSTPSHADVGFPGIWTPRVITLRASSSDAEVLYWFGRALGFDHELGRPADYEPCFRCTSASHCSSASQPQCLPSGFCGKVLDHESILAAPSCAGVEPTRTFTAWDIVALQRAYGRKHRGALVEEGGRCLQVRAGSLAPGTPIDAYLCLGSLAHNTWTFEPKLAEEDAGLLSVRLGEHTRCAETVDAPLATGPLGLLSQPCDHENAGQRVQLGPVQLRAFGGMCVVAAAASSGARLVVQGCELPGSEARPRDLFVPEGQRIRLFGSELCVAASDAPSLGDVLELRSCADVPSQHFLLRDREIHYLHPQGTGLCWDVLGGEPRPGSELGLWNGCGLNIENNVFFATAPLHVRDGCVEALEEPGSVNRPLGVTACAASRTQAWDIHW